jgi:hypothetical protein
MKFNALKNKRGFNLSTLQTAALGIVVLTIIVAMGAEILSKLQGTQIADSTSFNVTGQGLTAMSAFGDWFTVIVVVVVAVVILGLILLFGRIRSD